MSKVGSAHSTYDLDISGFRRSAEDVKRILRDLREQARAAVDEPIRLPPLGVPRAPRVPSVPRQQDDSAIIARRAAAEARLAQTSGDAARAEQILAAAINRVGDASDQGIRLQTQLQSMRNRQAQAAQRAAQQEEQTARRLLLQQEREAEQRRQQQEEEQARAASQTLRGRVGGVGNEFAAGFKDGLIGIVGPLAAATAALNVLSATANRVREGFNLRATLDEQRRGLGTLLGDVERGNQVFDTAIAFGKRYGFTQAEMGQSAAEAADLIKTSTVATEKQLEVLGRLASRNSQEGFSGAVYATKELQSGDVESLVERFNISRKAAAELKAEIASGKDAFVVLDQYLTQIGVTADVLANRTLGAAGATRTYAQAQEALTLKLGEFAEGPGVKALDILTRLTAGLTDMLSVGQGGQQGGVDAVTQALQGGQGYDAYLQGVIALKQQLATHFANDPIRASLEQQRLEAQQLTPIQYQLAQGWIAQGVAAGQAVAQAQALAPTLDQLAIYGDMAARGGTEMQAAYQALLPEMAALASTSEDMRGTVVELANDFINGGIGSEELRARIANLSAQSQQAAIDASDHADRELYRANALAISSGESANAANASFVLTGAMLEEASAKAEAELKAQNLAEANAFIAGIAGQVTGGLISNADAAAILRARYGEAASEAQRLLNLQIQLGQAKINAQAYQDQRAGERSGGRYRTAAQQTAASDQARKDYAAQVAYQQSLENSAQTAARYRKELSGMRKGSAEYYETLTKLNQAEKAAAAEATRGGGRKARGAGGSSARSGAKSPEVKAREQEVKQLQQLDDQLLKNEQKRQDQQRKEAERHAKALLKIDLDYYQKSLDAQKKNELDKRKSRSAFYRSLMDANLSAEDSQRISAQYEADFAEAQRLAQEGKQQQSQEYLAYAQERQQAEIDSAREIADAKKAISEAESDAERQQAEARLRQLEELRKLDADYWNERRKQIVEGGDDLQNERETQIAAESERYAEAQADIAASSEQAADRKIADTNRSIDRITAETTAIRDQARALDQLGTKRGDLPTTTAAPPTQAAPPPVAPPPASPPPAVATPPPGAQIVNDPVAHAALEAIRAATQAGVDQLVSMAAQLAATATNTANTTAAVRQLRGGEALR